VESGEASSSAQSPSFVRTTPDDDAVNGSNLPASASNENPSTTRHGGETVPPTSTTPKTAPSTRVKATSCAGKAASPKRSKSPSSGISLLWCIHPRGSKSRVSKSVRQDGNSSDGADARRPQSSTATEDGQRLEGDSVVTDSDRGSSLSECPPPTALDLARRLCSGDDDDDASSDYWSARASADHLPSTSCPVSTSAGSVRHTDHVVTSTTAGRACSTADSSLLTWRRNIEDSDMVGKS